MFFLNLTGPEFLTLLAALGGLIGALYLLDRARGRKVVSTLQFWVTARATDQHQPRKRVRDPWSLLLQLAALLLLLLAISRVQWGSRSNLAHDHVLLLDTSSWSAARAAGSYAGQSVIAQEKKLASRYLAALPRNDRVMLVSAASVAEPLTRFTADRRELTDALNRATPGSTALNREAVLAFASQARNWSEDNPGEIVYTGPQLVADSRTDTVPSPDRILPVPVDSENCGIRQFTAEPRAGEPNGWQALVTIENNGQRTRAVRLSLQFGSTAFMPRNVIIPAHGIVSAEYAFTTKAAGELVASIQPGGSLPDDDRASIHLPRRDLLHVAVFTKRPDVIKPLFTTDARVQAEFPPIAAYSRQTAADIIVLDGVVAPDPPRVPSLWINPPQDHSPLPISGSIMDSVITWKFAGSLASVVHAKPVHVFSTSVFETFDGEQVLASVPKGPVVVLRPGTRDRATVAAIGFDPAADPVRFEVATPLLFANLLEELSAGSFRSRSFIASKVGLARVQLEKEEQTDSLRVFDNRGKSVPFTLNASELQFFSAHPATVHVISGERERIFDLQLPAVADRFWNIPQAKQGVPSLSSFESPAIDLWKWLASAAAMLVLLEWYLYGRTRRPRKPSSVSSHREQEPESELAVK